MIFRSFTHLQGILSIHFRNFGKGKSFPACGLAFGPAVDSAGPAHASRRGAARTARQCRAAGRDCYRQKLTWSIWAKKQAAIKMGFEDNHD
jgi:hypothetical protein